MFRPHLSGFKLPNLFPFLVSNPHLSLPSKPHIFLLLWAHLGAKFKEWIIVYVKIWQSLINTLEICLLILGLVILFLGIYHKKKITHVHAEGSAKMFIAAWLKMAQNWKSLECPIMEEQVKKITHSLLYSYNRILRSH